MLAEEFAALLAGGGEFGKEVFAGGDVVVVQVDALNAGVVGECLVFHALFVVHEVKAGFLDAVFFADAQDEVVQQRGFAAAVGSDEDGMVVAFAVAQAEMERDASVFKGADADVKVVLQGVGGAGFFLGGEDVGDDLRLVGVYGFKAEVVAQFGQRPGGGRDVPVALLEVKGGQGGAQPVARVAAGLGVVRGVGDEVNPGFCRCLVEVLQAFPGGAFVGRL